MAKNNSQDNYFLKNYQKKEINKYTFEKITDDSKLKKEKDKKIYSRTRLISIYLILIGPENASKVIQKLTQTEVEQIIKEIFKINNINQNDLIQTEKKFGCLNINDLNNYKGGYFYAQNLLQKAYGIKNGSNYFIKYKEKEDDKEKFINSINKLPVDSIIKLILDESEMVVSIILTLIDSKKTAEIIKKLPKDTTIKILKRMSGKLEISPEVLDIIIRNLEKKIENLDHKNTIEIKGKEKLIEILKHSTIQKANSIINNLELTSPELADEIMDNLFTFNDISKIPKKSLVHALKNYKENEIAFLLKGADDNIKNTFFECISKKRKVLVQDEMEYLGKVKKNDVEDKRKDFIDYLKYLEIKGKIILFPESDEYI